MQAPCDTDYGLIFPIHPWRIVAEKKMADSEVDRIRQWVDCWKTAGLRLEELRRKELRHADTQESLQNLAGAFESCRLHHKPASTSGLIEQQRWFKRLAK